MQFSIQKKILLILVAANIAFIIYLTANIWSVTANRAKLNQVSNQQFPMLLLAQLADSKLEKSMTNYSLQQPQVTKSKFN